jgi:hypothetical protein
MKQAGQASVIGLFYLLFLKKFHEKTTEIE